MQDRPDIHELLEVIRSFIRDEAGPELSGRKAFLAKVAVNAIDIIGREIDSGPELDARELERLVSLLGQEGSLEELNGLLCSKIRNREMDIGDRRLWTHLWATSVAKVSIDQPKYSSYKSALLEGKEGAGGAD